MAWIEKRAGDRYRVAFRFSGKLFRHALGDADYNEAGRCQARIEETLGLLTRGVIELPPNVDIGLFLASGGKVENRPNVSNVTTLEEALKRYQETHAAAQEANSLDTIRIHVEHLIKTLGKRFRIRALGLADLQRHVDRRSRDDGLRGRKLSPTTIKKEIATLSAIWNWCQRMGIVEGSFPNKGLIYPKVSEKPPFQTWSEIERQVARGGMKEAEQRELWDCLFLTMGEIDEFLGFIKAKARHPWIYPMFAFAAHTGARRSEVLRSRITDFDFNSMTVLIHERKRDKSRRTTRRIPLSSHLAELIQAWFAAHPGGRSTITQPLQLPGNRKIRKESGPVTIGESNDHFKRLVERSK